jgi:hypothetical protein
MRRVLAIVLIVMLAVSVTATAEDKTAAKEKSEKLTDFVEIVLHPGADKSHAVAEVTAGNVNPLRVLSLPFKFGAGDQKIRVDSISFAGTRVEYFDQKHDTLYEKRSALLMLLLAPNKDKKYLDLQPGAGIVARIYFSAKDTFPMDAFQMAPVTLPPNNKFMYVTEVFAGAEPSFAFRVAGAKKEAQAEKTN